MDTNKLKQDNQKRWNNCHVPQTRAGAFKSVADRLLEPTAVARYKKVEALTGVPYWFIAVVHERESNQNWETMLANGDPLNKKSTHVPAGRGPFTSWEDGAVDALVNCPPYAARNKDWSVGSALTMLEMYNGPGYAERGVPSPYIWAGTDQYTKGKFVADGVYSADAVDQQLGCAGLLKFMGVFKTAPTGLGTAAGAVVLGAGTAAAATQVNHWAWLGQHWVGVLLGCIGVGLFIDLCFAIYNNEKNQLKVSNPSNVRSV